MSPSSTPDLQLNGRFEPDAELTYRHLPFTVPARVRQVHFSIGYNARIGSSPTLRGGNTLDIGVFDARGIEAGGAGFRGWSGSEKTEITIGRDWATPPYRAGELQAGEWNLLLGAYKVAPEGLEYSVAIWFDPGLEQEIYEDEPTPLPNTEARTPPLESGWVRGDLHCHSIRSDGDSTPEALLARAKALGFDFLGTTDHNAPPSADLAPDDGPLLIPGTEVTTYGGHWNVWGGTRWYDFREPVREAMARQIANAREIAGLVSVNHPRPLGPNWEYGFDLPFHAIEIWNGPWLYFNAISLAKWDNLLRAGQRVVAVGGSDTHLLKGAATGPLPRAKLGEPTVWVKPEGPVTVESVLDGLRRGRSFISASPNGPQLILEAVDANALRVHAGDAEGTTLMLIGDQGVVESVAIDSDDWERHFAFPDSSAYVRAQITDAASIMQAVSNPIWRDPADE